MIGPHDGGPGTNDLGGDLDGDEQLSTPARRGFGLLVLAVIAATAVAVLSPQGMAYANTLLHRWLP